VKVFVAGATGALGVPVVRQLVEKGHQVTALTRSASKVELLRELGATPAVADVFDEGALKAAVSEAAPDGVVHALTALPKNGPVRASHLQGTNRIRRIGTANLISAASAAGARRFVGESIVLVYGHTGDRVATEGDPIARPAPGDASQEVLAAVLSLEDQILEATAAGSIEGVVLRYGLFYGPTAGSTEYILRLLRRGVPMLPADGRGVSSWIHLEDAASATVAALERGRRGEVYNVVDDEPVALRDLTSGMAEAIGAKPPRRLPMWLARLGAPMLAAGADVQLRASNEKAKRELDWTLIYPTYREGAASLSRG
jgi:nucleoside-diphosphate-sugar epimerase